MLVSTKAIVFSTIKYGDTSLIVNLFTETLGLNTYIINGIRKANKSGNSKANMFTPGSILNIVAYNAPNKNMQRLKEFEYAYIYKSISQSVVKNAVLTYCVELTSKCIQEPSPMSEVFDLLHELAMFLDANPIEKITNLPYVYSLLLANELGIKIQGVHSPSTPYLSLGDAMFVANLNNDALVCDAITSESISNLNQLNFYNANTAKVLVERKILLQKILQYLQLHISAVQQMRSPAILHSIFE